MMKTSRTRIARVIAEHSFKKGVSEPYSKEIASYLLTERRVGELDSLLRDVRSEWAQLGHVEVVTTSVYPLTIAIKTNITSQVKKLYPAAKKIIITERYDSDMIGGVRLSLPDQQLDVSIETKLNTFKQHIAVGGKA